MKYLRSREEFLTKSKTKIDLYRKYENVLIQEAADSYGSGPMANDIPWGDSLLGRLINSTIRKAKIKADLMRMSGPIKRLKAAMKELVDSSVLFRYSDDQMYKFTRIQLYFILKELWVSIEKKYEIDLIKSITDNTIENVQNLLKDKKLSEKLDKAKIEKLLDELKKFREFLNKFEDIGEGGGDEDEDEDEDKDEDKDDVLDEDALYLIYIDNFKSSLKIVNLWIKANQERAKQFNQAGDKNKESGAKSELQKIDKEGSKVAKTNDELNIDTDFDYRIFEDDNFIKKLSEPKSSKLLSYLDFLNEAGLPGVGEYNKTKIGFKPDAKDDVGTKDESGKEPAKTEAGKEPAKTEAGKEPAETGATPAKPEAGKTTPPANQKASQIVNLIKSLHGFVMQIMPPKSKGSESEDILRFLKMSDDALLQKQFKDPIMRVYGQVKKTVGGGVNEDINNLLSRAEELGKKIGLLYLESKKKQDGKFEGLGPDLQKEIGIFNETMSESLSASDELKEKEKEKKGQKEAQGQKKEEAKESFSKYNGYYPMINEADENEEGSEENQDKQFKEIENYFQKNVTSWGWIKMEETEIEKIRKELTEIEADDETTIIGLDPIIDIVKAFNRAYKLHTTQVIRTGRSGGRVSNKTFMEYTCFGDGKPDSAGEGGGPYRNNKLFDKWEAAVHDAMQDTQYQKIFRGETVLKSETGKIIKDAGKNLRKFMTDMLDGEKLYKSGGRGGEGGGAQSEFLERYFGAAPKDAEDLSFKTESGGLPDANVNSDNSGKIKTKKFEFTKDSISFRDPKELIGTFFIVNVEYKNSKGENKDKKVHFFVQGVNGDTLYVTYCDSFYFFKKYIKSSGEALDGSVANVGKQEDKTEGKEYKIKGLKVKNFIKPDGSLAATDKYSITYVTKYSDGKNSISGTKSELSASKDEYKFKSLLTLVSSTEDEKEKKRFQLKNKDIDGPVKKTGAGFADLERADNINKTEFKK
jgi:hypothetical protein